MRAKVCNKRSAFGKGQDQEGSLWHEMRKIQSANKGSDTGQVIACGGCVTQQDQKIANLCVLKTRAVVFFFNVATVAHLPLCLTLSQASSSVTPCTPSITTSLLPLHSASFVQYSHYPSSTRAQTISALPLQLGLQSAQPELLYTIYKAYI